MAKPRKKEEVVVSEPEEVLVSSDEDPEEIEDLEENDHPDFEEDTEPVAAKEHSRAEEYKALVQKVILEVLGIKVSKAKAWEFYKTLIYKTVTDVADNGRIPISGVNTWEIQNCGARKGKIDTHNFVPKFRFRASSKIDDYLEKVLPGVRKDGSGNE